MFPKTNNIETAFRHVRLFTVMVICGSFFFSALVAWISYLMLNKSSNTIYVLASGKAMEATAADRRENIPVEARDHIRNFHQLFFTLDPDEKVIEANLGKALYLADGSAKRLYDNLRENGYYAGIISGNISQQVAVDSIVLDTRPYPMVFRCYATERIIRPTSIVTRSLITEGWLRTTGRSDNNPHGFLIERWVIIDNKDLKVEER